MAENGICFVENYEDMEKIDASFYDFMSTRGVNSIYGIAVKSYDNHIIGFIGVEYINKPEVDLERINHCLSDKKNKIEAVLDLANKSKHE